jgi:hypothetical protein
MRRITYTICALITPGTFDDGSLGNANWTVYKLDDVSVVYECSRCGHTVCHSSARADVDWLEAIQVRGRHEIDLDGYSSLIARVDS